MLIRLEADFNQFRQRKPCAAHVSTVCQKMTLSIDDAWSTHGLALCQDIKVAGLPQQNVSGNIELFMKHFGQFKGQRFFFAEYR